MAIASVNAASSTATNWLKEAQQSLAASEIKRRREAIEAFAAAGRTESAAKEAQEIQVLQGYLPPQLSEAEVAEIVDRELQGKNFGAADFGKAMGAVMPALKGKAEGTLISKILKEKLK